MFSLKAGRGINIGFTMDSYKVLDVIAATPTSTRINGDTGELMGEPQPIRTTHRSWGRYEDALLSYNEFLDEYRFPWKTTATWRNQCRRLAVSLVDDTIHTVDGRFY